MSRFGRRVIAVIPHWFGAGSASFSSCDPSSRTIRIAALERVVTSLHRHFGGLHAVACHDGTLRRVGREGGFVEIVICVRKDEHLLDSVDLSPTLYRLHRCDDTDPRLLGFSCHRILREAVGGYDWYCYLEDDIVVDDPLFFDKLEAFALAAGDGHHLLLPNRREELKNPLPGKLFVDGPLWPDAREYMESIRLPGSRDRIDLTFGPHRYRMLPAVNPHAGCFFLDAEQMAFLAGQPWYGEPVVGFGGPLESAATQYLLTLFHLYKPADENPSFLEVIHASPRFAGKPLRLHPSGRMT